MTHTWIYDDNGNRCSVEYFGSVEAAQKALDSLVNCRRCTNCKNCEDCQGCTNCTMCTSCWNCLGCSGCDYCSGCWECFSCLYCVDCSWCLNRENSVRGKQHEKDKPPRIPKIVDIHKVVYTAASQPGSLDMSAWHSCDNTHCRAGWVVALAGAQGFALEKFFNTELAAMLIYKASDPGFNINPGRFYDKNHAALTDMKRLSEGTS
jgi:hypothetical protein